MAGAGKHFKGVAGAHLPCLPPPEESCPSLSPLATPAPQERKQRWVAVSAGERLFGLDPTPFPGLERTEQEIGLLTQLYDLYTAVLSAFTQYGGVLWVEVPAQLAAITQQVAEFQVQCKKLPKVGGLKGGGEGGR